VLRVHGSKTIEVPLSESDSSTSNKFDKSLLHEQKSTAIPHVMTAVHKAENYDENGIPFNLNVEISDCFPTTSSINRRTYLNKEYRVAFIKTLIIDYIIVIQNQ
jgi:hypothetical protein